MQHMPFPDRFPGLEQDLRVAYGQAHRSYHTWAHIEDLLGWYRRLAHDWAAPEAVELALYYHDAVYVPGSRTNETDSAARMVDELTGRIAAPVLAVARQIIEATAEHRLPVAWSADLRQDCALFLDMDMSILGTDRDRFDAYDHAIRQEFNAVPDALYRTGRAKVLQGFLDRERIFLTDRFHQSHEAQARANLTRALHSLGGGTGS